MTTKQKVNKKKTDEEEVVDPFRVVFRGKAANYSGRLLGYEVGHNPEDDSIALRIKSNESSGTFSKEWIAISAIRKVLPKESSNGEPFHPGKVCQMAYVGKSKNNGPFAAHVLRHEGLLTQDEEKPSHAVLSGDWEEWKKRYAAMETLPPIDAEAVGEREESAKQEEETADKAEEADVPKGEGESEEMPAEERTVKKAKTHRKK